VTGTESILPVIHESCSLMSMLKQIVHYFTVYRKYVGNRLYVVFALSALAAATEGFGIAMLLPLMAAANVDFDGQGLEASGVGDLLQQVVGWIGVEGSMIGIMFLIATMFLVKGLLVFVAQAYQTHLQAQLMRELKSMMFDRYSTMDYGYYCRHNTGHFVNIINGQVAGVISSFMGYKQFLSIVVATIIYLLTAFLLAWDFALMAMVAGLLLLFLFRGLNAYVARLSRKASIEKSTLNKFLVQTMQAFKYLSSTAELSYLRKGIVQSIDRLAYYMRGKGIAKALTESLSEPVSIFFVLIVIVIQVVVLDAPLVPIFVALLLFNRAIGGIMRIQKAWQGVLSQSGSVEMIEKECARLENNQESSGECAIGPFSAHFTFRDVSFSYPGIQEDVLSSISLEIKANTTVAIVGESGAGKSTLVDMLTLLLRPRCGEVYIDGVAGTDVKLDSWRTQIGYVSQETVVFDDTIANNIAMWKENYNDSAEIAGRIERAAAMAYADHFIRDLPKGYNTIVGDRGIRLSGGQRQRLFLARELYKKPRLLILDEATSALDSESELYIRKSIDALRGQTTVVIIAHRLSTIKNSDYICVMERGRIIEAGDYQALNARQSSHFHSMVQLQAL
jgi:ABC-type multidrug transport system fused ATPase/permease subunit